jgi:hypothetical protein
MLNAWPMGFYPPATLVHDARRHGVTGAAAVPAARRVGLHRLRRERERDVNVNVNGKTGTGTDFGSAGGGGSGAGRSDRGQFP